MRKCDKSAKNADKKKKKKKELFDQKDQIIEKVADKKSKQKDEEGNLVFKNKKDSFVKFLSEKAKEWYEKSLPRNLNKKSLKNLIVSLEAFLMNALNKKYKIP